MSSERVMVELTPDEYMQLRDEAAERSTADAPRDIPASLSANEDHQIQDAQDDEVVPFAAAAGLADQAELTSATAAPPKQPSVEHDPDPHFDKLATQTAISQRPSGPSGTASIDAPPARPKRRRAAQRPARTGGHKAPLRLHRRWTTLAAVAISVVVLALVLERPSQPTAASPARPASAVSEPALTTLGQLVAPAVQDIAVLGRQAEAAIEKQAARAERQRRIAQRRHQRRRPARPQQPRTTVSRGASVQRSQVSAPSTPTVAGQSPSAVQSKPPAGSSSASTYTHQQSGPTSLGSQVGSNCDPTCR